MGINGGWRGKVLVNGAVWAGVAVGGGVVGGGGREGGAVLGGLGVGVGGAVLTGLGGTKDEGVEMVLDLGRDSTGAG